jgi:hypothetical protein
VRVLLLGCLLIGAGFIAQIVLFILKAVGATDISWWIVFSPALCVLALYVVLSVLGKIGARLLLGRMAVVINQDLQRSRYAKSSRRDDRVIEGEVVDKRSVD